MARAVHRLDQHRTTWRATSAAPRTHRKLSCSPAKLASGASSQVAEDRTATGRASVPHCRHRRVIGRGHLLGHLVGQRPGFDPGPHRGGDRLQRPGVVGVDARRAAPSPPGPGRIPARWAVKASVVTAKPGGTASPAPVISPRLAFFPPTTATARLCTHRSAPRRASTSASPHLGSSSIGGTWTSVTRLR